MALGESIKSHRVHQVQRQVAPTLRALEERRGPAAIEQIAARVRPHAAVAGFLHLPSPHENPLSHALPEQHAWPCAPLLR